MADQQAMTTSIAHVAPDRIVVRGLDLTELIGGATATEYFYFLLTGSRPTPVQTRVLDSCIVALAEHGLVPSVQAARMTFASGPESLQGAVAAGLLGCGSVILGSSEATGILLRELVLRHRDGEGSLEQLAADVVRRLRAEGRQVPGVGHPVHRQVDPRSTALLDLVSDLGVSGEHVAAVHALVAGVREVTAKSLPLNVSGAIPAVLLDVGFPLEGMKGVPLVGRTMSLVAHLVEEQMAPLGFRLAAAAETAVDDRAATA